MPASHSHRRPAPFDRFLFGAAYYPEHWDEKTWQADPALMAAAGFNAVRMAEFAWDLMEPVEGQFDFSLFDRAIEALSAKGIKTILCTPTAAPPRWLTVKHPEMLRINADLVPMAHGSRQHCCHSNRVFRDYSEKITTAMTDHYKDNPHVVGWQTDNEFLCHISECYCDACTATFREFLLEKYGDIGALNTAWGTAFWAQTYDSFDDVVLPRPKKPTHVNPAHRLDYFRFISWSVTRFQHDQVRILRPANPAWFITHNGIFGHIDYRGKFGEDLDVLGFDCYPSFDRDVTTRRFSHAFNLDRARAWTGNFIIPEQQSGPGGQTPFFLDTPEPGELRRMTYSALARGADSLLYFRWRTCRFGAEEYWCGIIDHDNVPRRRYDEVAQVGTELAAVGPELSGTSVKVEAAVASRDHEINDSHAILHLGLPAPETVAESVHGLLNRNGYATGCVHPSDDLTGLKLYVIPHWTLFNPDWLPNLEAFVENGGTLVIGARTATLDMNNNVTAETVPGCLRDLAGITVQDYGPQNDTAHRPLLLDIGGTAVQSEHWYEILESDGEAEPLATWATRHQRGSMAVSVRKTGKGRVVYAGTYLTEPVMDALLPLLLDECGLEPLWAPAPEGVEVVVREKDGAKLWFFINHNDSAVTVPAVPDGADVLNGGDAGGAVVLEANGVMLIRTT